MPNVSFPSPPRTSLPESLRWFCPPSRWSFDPQTGLWIEPDAETDFWSRTHYGFEAHNGHFLFETAAADFVLSTRVQIQPVHQYDQAGLMVRISRDCWFKTSVEYEGGAPARLGAVVTNHGYSDWSTQDVPASVREFSLRVTRTGADYLIESSLDGSTWSQIRLAHLHEVPPPDGVECGLYACSPKGAGFRALFCDFSLVLSA